MNTEPSIHLQSVGRVPAIPAGDLKPGMRLMWNFGYTSDVVSVTPVGAKSIVVVERSTQTGTESSRRFLKTRLVARVQNAEEQAASERERIQRRTAELAAQLQITDQLEGMTAAQQLREIGRRFSLLTRPDAAAAVRKCEYLATRADALQA